MYTSSIFARGKAAAVGTETEQRLTVLLYDDAVQVISTLELHQLATLSYQESQVITTATPDIRDIILDHLEKIQRQPAHFSTLTIQKSLVLTRHLLLFGSDKIIPTITQQLGHCIDALREYNTVLIAQQQAGGMWMRLKGGGVDQGGPVRELATKVIQLLQHPTTLLVQERNRVADPTSLVPVGDRKQVGWGSEQLRYQQLQAQLKREQALQTRSNLAKADNGFGSGYNAANGQTVVGAAHGIEEMLAQQRKLEQKFRDDKAAAAAATGASFSEYQAPDLLAQQTQTMPSSIAAPPPAPEMDLLDFGSPTAAAPPPPTGDLLGSMAPPTTHSFAPPETTVDPFAPPTSLPGSDDPFGFASPPATTTTPVMSTPSADLLGTISSSQPDPSATTFSSSTPGGVLPSEPTLLGLGEPIASAPPVEQQRKPVMGSSQIGGKLDDPFAVLNGTGEASSSSSAFGGLGAISSNSNPSSSMLGTSPKPPAAPSAFGGLGSISSMQQQRQPPPPSTAAFNGLGLSGTPSSSAFDNLGTTMPTQKISLSSIQVSGGGMPPTENDDSENGFLMGGGVGDGLSQPLGPAPGAPPPPPPPPSPGLGGFY